MFTALSNDFGNLGEKLTSFSALAPIAYLSHTPNTMIHQLAGYWKQIWPVASTFKIEEIKDPVVDSTMKGFCHVFNSVCVGISSFLNMESSPYNSQDAEEIEDYRPDSSASLKQLIHYAQCANTGFFREFDYGNDKDNTAHYGSFTIPDIDLGKITQIPVGLFVGKEDDLGSPADTRIVKEKIGRADFYKEYDNMDHYSFQIGKDMSYIHDLMDFLKKTGTPPTQ